MYHDKYAHITVANHIVCRLRSPIWPQDGHARHGGMPLVWGRPAGMRADCGLPGYAGMAECRPGTRPAGRRPASLRCGGVVCGRIGHVWDNPARGPGRESRRITPPWGGSLERPIWNGGFWPPVRAQGCAVQMNGRAAAATRFLSATRPVTARRPSGGSRGRCHRVR